MSDENIFNSVPATFYTEPAAATDFEAFEVVAKSRRSVRVYEKTSIPEAVMRQCFRIAFLAPNSSNMQPWQVHWVRSEDKKQELVRACLSQPAAKTAPELVVFTCRTDQWKRNRDELVARMQKASSHKIPSSVMAYYQKTIPMVYNNGPLGIFGPLKKIMVNIVGIFKPIPRQPMGKSDLKMMAVKTTALACENFMLALRASGYDSCPMEGFDSARVKKILGLGCESTVVMVISAGKRAPNGIYGPSIRLDESWSLKEI